jgi:hypothetical protein
VRAAAAAAGRTGLLVVDLVQGRANRVGEAARVQVVVQVAARRTLERKRDAADAQARYGAGSLRDSLAPVAPRQPGARSLADQQHPRRLDPGQVA